MRDYLKRLLSQQYEVEAVTDGVAELAAAYQQRPDLVLTDIMMPRLDGFGLLRALRADPQTQELPIILLSARAGEESRIEGLEAGADDYLYLIKPFSVRELLAKVEANLKLAQLRQEATQREQAQRQAAEVAREQLEMVLSSIHDQFVVLDQDWRYTYVNRQVIETVGMPKDDLLGKSIWELFPALVGSEWERQMQWAIAEQTPVHFDYLYPTWNRWFEIHAYPSSEGLTLFITEISDRKQAEAALHQSSAILNTINQSTPTLIFVKDRQGRLRMGNPALIRVLGKPKSEIIGHTDAEVYLNPDDAEPIMANDRQVMETGQMQVLEETLELPEGRRTFLSTKSPYLDETGTITGLVGVGSMSSFP
jgi:PAS domain S-box-containing protein